MPLYEYHHYTRALNKEIDRRAKESQKAGKRSHQVDNPHPTGMSFT